MADPTKVWVQGVDSFDGGSNSAVYGDADTARAVLFAQFSACEDEDKSGFVADSKGGWYYERGDGIDRYYMRCYEVRSLASQESGT
jgi:hypothetical protein